MLPCPLRHYPLLERIMLTMTMLVMTRIVYCKPQDPNMFEKVASQVVGVAGNMAEMMGNAGMISKQLTFELPFASAKSDSQFANGAAMRDKDYDSSEEDRRKRSVGMQVAAIDHQHVHRGKRSACHKGTGGSGSMPNYDDDDVDVAERRRRARRRKAAQKMASRSKSTTKKSKKKLVNDDTDDDYDNQVLARRKRQSELDDLNDSMVNGSKNFTQKAQEVAEKIRNMFENVAKSITDMAQNFKQHFSGQGSTNIMEQ